MAGQAWKARPGDVVRLKSGGAVMTAERINHGVDQPFAKCIWLDARQAPRRAFIVLDALDLVSDEDSANTDCPDARMAGGNHHNNNNERR
ncbi:MAG TPA: DUF2158 domain-containing protein [Caulobacteraceae bacterium]|jgi:uncharacterized protein YodC (DUF2158 family)|nr:DUF2158 domain-containing protein [Caulobacteraceae bacterium]